MKIYILVGLVAQPVMPTNLESEAGTSRVELVLTSEFKVSFSKILSQTQNSKTVLQ